MVGVSCRVDGGQTGRLEYKPYQFTDTVEASDRGTPSNGNTCLYTAKTKMSDTDIGVCHMSNTRVPALTERFDRITISVLSNFDCVGGFAKKSDIWA